MPNFKLIQQAAGGRIILARPVPGIPRRSQLEKCMEIAESRGIEDWVACEGAKGCPGCPVEDE